MKFCNRDAANFDCPAAHVPIAAKDALSDVDIHLEPGSLNAFVGPSGAGKTTAVQLLGRYWDVSSGTIKIGGVPVTELQTENLSDLTAFVFQDVFLLEDTLLENIRMGTDATEEQVRQAAKAAQIDDFIMSLPKGYATRIGDEGVKLSGGQQQRISIARAILKDAPIVVFDEATSYSDIENEHKIQLALQNLLRGKTTIMIAHRLHTIRNADKIFVFQDGKVVEQGTHDELIASGSTYSHMWDTYKEKLSGRSEKIMLRSIQKLIGDKRKQLIFPIFLMSLDAIGSLVMYLMLYFTVIHLLNGSLTGGLVRNYTIYALSV